MSHPKRTQLMIGMARSKAEAELPLVHPPLRAFFIPVHVLFSVYGRGEARRGSPFRLVYPFIFHKILIYNFYFYFLNHILKHCYFHFKQIFFNKKHKTSNQLYKNIKKIRIFIIYNIYEACMGQKIRPRRKKFAPLSPRRLN